jgi:hypothetical protein
MRRAIAFPSSSKSPPTCSGKAEKLSTGDDLRLISATRSSIVSIFPKSEILWINHYSLVLMAKLPEQLILSILNLQRQLIEGIDEATALETLLFQQFGETEENATDLEQIQNIKQKFTDPYTRLHNLLLRIAEFQPIAPDAMLDLLAQTIVNGQAAIGAGQASLQEIRRDWNL